jgi:hypothetical protein
LLALQYLTQWAKFRQYLSLNFPTLVEWTYNSQTERIREVLSNDRFERVAESRLAKYIAQLARVEKGEMWGKHPGPYTAEEKAGEIARIKSLIARFEVGDAERP